MAITLMWSLTRVHEDLHDLGLLIQPHPQTLFLLYSLCSICHHLELFIFLVYRWLRLPQPLSHPHIESRHQGTGTLSHSLPCTQHVKHGPSTWRGVINIFDWMEGINHSFIWESNSWLAKSPVSTISMVLAFHLYTQGSLWNAGSAIGIEGSIL